MSQLNAKFVTLFAIAGLLLGCSASEQVDSLKSPQIEAAPLRAGPALTDAALAGMYMSRDGKTPEGTKFVACLDNFVEGFDTDADVKRIFGEIAAETDSPIELGNVAYFTDQALPERYKRLVDRMIALNAKTDGDIFNFDSSSACMLSPEDCSLATQDANIVRLYWSTIEHGSQGCYE